MAVQFNDLLGIYRSFKTNDDIMKTHMSKSTSSPKLKELLELLFPRTTGKFPAAAAFFDEFKALGTASKNPAGEAEKEMAKLIRVYYYEPASAALATMIKGWYEKPRLDAYQIVNPGVSGDKNRAYDKENYISAAGLSSFFDGDPRGAKQLENLNSKILMCLVDSPAIDFKLRNADKVEVFTNYIPATAISQAVPYLDVKFLSKRNVAPKDVKERNIGFMSQLHFLMGDGKTAADTKSTSANALIYDASNYMLKDNMLNTEPARETELSLASAGRQAAAAKVGLPEQSDSPAPMPRDTSSVLQQHVFVTGMEMFTSPQTLINLDQDLSRYSPVINPPVPFATIVGLTVTMVPSYDVFSFKTATLVLKIFDRSRLSEIADFLNPQLYSSTSVLLTYGWRAPQQPVANDANDANDVNQNPYHDFINNHMLMSESYGIQNSSISIDNSGVVTVTLVLFTKGGAELNDITPNGESINFKSEQTALMEKINKIKELATKLKLSEAFAKSAKDVRGTIVISSALNGTFPELDPQLLKNEIAALESALTTTVNNTSLASTGGEAKDLLTAIKELYTVSTAPDGQSRPSAQYAVLAKIESAAAQLTTSRFSMMKEGKDLFNYSNGQPSPAEQHPLVTNNVYAKFDKNAKPPSFGKVFFKYFATACGGMKSGADALLDEYQIFFYSLNENAGPVASLNIAEFPIDIKKLEAVYTKHVVDKKGENMTLVTFLELIRTSQFGDIRHPAFGFADLYHENDAKDDAKGNVVRGELKSKSDGALLQRTLNANKGTGEAFVQPALDFYVESGVNKTTTAAQDLLSLFEHSAEARTTNGKYKRKDGSSIIRIHIFDRAATPHAEASQILKAQDGGYIRKTGKFKQTPIQRTTAEADAYTAKPAREQSDDDQARFKAAEQSRDAEAAKTITTKRSKQPATAAVALDSIDLGDGIQYTYVTLSDENGKPSFDVVKRVISEMVPTIIVGAEGSMITNMSYSSNMDSALSTMMIMNGQSSQSPSQPNGSGLGELPLRVIPGQLTMTLMGCPLLEYMQQFFVDLGTGTTLDNLYNVVGITHKFDPGRFSTEVKFGFYDAYGKFEGAAAIVNEVKAVTAIMAAAPRPVVNTGGGGARGPAA